MKTEMIARKWKMAEDLGVANIVEDALFSGGRVSGFGGSTTTVAPMPENQVMVLSMGHTA